MRFSTACRTIISAWVEHKKYGTKKGLASPSGEQAWSPTNDHPRPLSNPPKGTGRPGYAPRATYRAFVQDSRAAVWQPLEHGWDAVGGQSTGGQPNPLLRTHTVARTVRRRTTGALRSISSSSSERSAGSTGGSRRRSPTGAGSSRRRTAGDGSPCSGLSRPAGLQMPLRGDGRSREASGSWCPTYYGLPGIEATFATAVIERMPSLEA